jgi:MinD-like ATPase involved in chromosome partitioning or flagellar assembly
MSRIVSIHSFRGGTGKSNTAASVAALLAQQGRRVGVVDTDIQSPGVHVLFGFDEDRMVHSLNDYLWGRCPIRETSHDVTPAAVSAGGGRIYLIPSSLKAGEIARVLREGYDVGLLNDGFHTLVRDLRLDVLLIDTHPGMNEETLLSIAISDALAVILRPDHQDYQGTAVTVEVARKLGVPRMVLVVNKVPPAWDRAAIRARVEQTYGCPVAGIMPHSDEMMVLASAGIFALEHPAHPVTATLKEIAAALVG